jgi:hypothetical protein
MVTTLCRTCNSAYNANADERLPLQQRSGGRRQLSQSVTPLKPFFFLHASVHFDSFFAHFAFLKPKATDNYNPTIFHHGLP